MFLILLALTGGQPAWMESSNPSPPISLHGPLGMLFSADDYPKEARDRHEQGDVGFVIDIGTDGLVHACRITASSGSSSLDAKTCDVIHHRARFRPARDSHGQPTPSTMSTTIHWAL